MKRAKALGPWLAARGAEVLTTTNPWEVARFRAGGEVSIIYEGATGAVSCVGPHAQEALTAFQKGASWTAPAQTRRKAVKKPVLIRTLIERDGDACFFCGLALGDDISVEHLVPRVHGGPNHISNYVLAHAACNRLVGHLSAAEKVRQRDAMRIGGPTP